MDLSDNTPATYAAEAVNWLSHLISIPSLSRDEAEAADYYERVMRSVGLCPQRHGNNLWCIAPRYDTARPTLLLNAHIDTVKPSASWVRNPYEATIEGDRIYGLGSNDDGGSLVALLQTFRILSEHEQTYNLVYLASAEEEVSGRGGVESVLPLLPPISVAVVGEPTCMQPAIAEKGLMVLDVTAHGKSGHAARGEGVNAIYEAMRDMEWFRTHSFERVSPLVGEVRTTVTIVNAGSQHNVVPDVCTFTVDVRTTECYTNEEILAEVRAAVHSDVEPRSTRLSSSHIPLTHPIVERAFFLGLVPYGSPTLSDQALMPFHSIKIGPGDSARSHTADEYIYISEIEQGIDLYVKLLDGLKL